jgi:hypothetical protein
MKSPLISFVPTENKKFPTKSDNLFESKHERTVADED